MRSPRGRRPALLDRLPFISEHRMNICIALFRGINVGGKNPLPMNGLTAILEKTGANEIKTYIQSGNAVFKIEEGRILRYVQLVTAEIKKQYGFEPHILVLGLDEIDQAIANNPFWKAEIDPSTLHLGFLASVPKRPDLQKLSGLRTGGESFHLKERLFYLYAPEGVGRSKLYASAEKSLGVPMTVRNWKTVCKIKELAGEMNAHIGTAYE